MDDLFQWFKSFYSICVIQTNKTWIVQYPKIIQIIHIFFKKKEKEIYHETLHKKCAQHCIRASNRFYPKLKRVGKCNSTVFQGLWKMNFLGFFLNISRYSLY